MTISPQPLDADQLNRLYQYAMLLCQQRDDAYDLLQGAVEKYLLASRQRPVDKPMAFLRRLIRNRFIDDYRHRRRWDCCPYEEAASYDISPLNLEQLSIDQDRLDYIWPQLQAKDRLILYHWAVLGYSLAEISEQLQIARGTLLSRLHRLRQHWLKHDDDQQRERPA